MAAYLVLRCRETGDKLAGRALIGVDERMARALGHEPDPEHWFRGWMNWAGFAIAVRGDKSIADALNHHMTPHETFGEPNPDTVEVCQWLIENFENDSYIGF